MSERVIDINEYRIKKTGNEFICCKCGSELYHEGGVVSGSTLMDFSDGEAKKKYLCCECSRIKR